MCDDAIIAECMQLTDAHTHECQAGLVTQLADGFTEACMAIQSMPLSLVPVAKQDVFSVQKHMRKVQHTSNQKATAFQMPFSLIAQLRVWSDSHCKAGRAAAEEEDALAVAAMASTLCCRSSSRTGNGSDRRLYRKLQTMLMLAELHEALWCITNLYCILCPSMQTWLVQQLNRFAASLCNRSTTAALRSIASVASPSYATHMSVTATAKPIADQLLVADQILTNNVVRVSCCSSLSTLERKFSSNKRKSTQL